MAGVTLSIQPQGLSAVHKQLQQLIHRGDNLQPLMAEIGEMLLLSHDQRFRDQTSPDGQPWQPLSSRYRDKKPKHKDTILKLNDHLGRELNYIATSSELFFGTPYIYGALQHYGGTPDMPAGPAAVPARPWLGISEQDINDIYTLIGDFMQNG